MLKIADLRLGNRILYGVDKLTEKTVTIADLVRIQSAGNTTQHTDWPIPISEKLLADRCGMHVDESTGSGTQTVDADSVTIQRKYLPSGGFLFMYKDIKIELRGLHHLQNIWYDVFGTELEIK